MAVNQIIRELFNKLNFIPDEQKLIVTPKDDLIERVILLLSSENIDYSQNAVVFPGKRPSHYLRKALADKIKNPFIPPKIFSADEFINFIFKKISNSISIEAVDAVGIIHEICIKTNFLTPFFKKFDNFLPFGFKLLNLFEELYIEGVSVEKLKEVETLIDIPVNSKNSLRFLSQTYKNFYEELINRNLSTRSLRYRTVAEADLNSCLNFKRLIFAGFFAFTQAEKIILEKLNKIENFFIILQDSEEFLNNKIKFYSCPDIHGEVKIAGEIIKKIANPDEKTVIVLPKADTLFPLLRQGIPYLDEKDYNISMGYPLSRTPIYGFFMSLFELLNSIDNGILYIPLYLKFMLHPYTKNILFKNSAELSRIILHEIENFFKSEKVIPFVDIEFIEKEIPLKIAQKINEPFLTAEDIGEHIKFIHENTIKKFLTFDSIEEFIKACKDILIFIYEKSTAKFHPLFYPYVEAFLTEFDKISNSLIGKLQFEFRDSYFNFFKNLIMSASVPFQGTPLKGLQILGFLETRTIKFKKIIFLDLNEGVFPDLSEDYLMPYRIRKVLGLPTYNDREKLIYYYFSTLIKGAEESHLIYIKNDKNERSRFIEKLIWEMEKNTGVKFEDDSSNLIASLSYKVNLSGKIPQEIPKTQEAIEILNNLPFSATALDDYLKCGIRFYYSYVLGLRKNREISSDLDRSDIGSIVHETLKEYFKIRTGKILTVKDFTEEIEDILNSILLQRYGNKITGRLYLLKLQIMKKMNEVISHYKEISKRQKVVIVSVEEYFEEELFGSKFTCRIDRVEKTEEKIFIVDYKITGKQDYLKIKFDKISIQDRQSWANNIGSLQIPLYMLLYSKRYDFDLQDINGYYFLLGKPIIDKNAFLNPFAEIEKNEGLSTIATVIENLINEIKNPQFSFKPATDFKNSCKNCDYQPMCGTLTFPSKTSSAGPVI